MTVKYNVSDEYRIFYLAKQEACKYQERYFNLIFDIIIKYCGYVSTLPVIDCSHRPT